LVRWGIADQELNAYVARESKRRTYLNGANFKKGTNEYYPIPQNAITYSVKAGKPTLTQNPGY
jgi:starch-binding outer membrane protein, SusD/RagB family